MTLPKKKKVLIVDDDQNLLDVYSGKLSSEGFSVRMAKNGKEGLEISIKEQPDLILLDIIMPVMNGMTMLKKLREDDWGKDAKVILLTGLNDPQEMTKAIEDGAFDYLIKSDWKLEDVVKKVKERLGI